MKYLFAFILILSIFLESSFITLPLVLGILLMLASLYRSSVVFLLAFFSGIVLDILTFHLVGASPLFFLGALLLVFLYQRKFEIQSPVFLGASVFVFSLLYGALFVRSFSFSSAVVTTIVIELLYFGTIYFTNSQS